MEYRTDTIFSGEFCNGKSKAELSWSVERREGVRTSTDTGAML